MTNHHLHQNSRKEKLDHLADLWIKENKHESIQKGTYQKGLIKIRAEPEDIKYIEEKIAKLLMKSVPENSSLKIGPIPTQDAMKAFRNSTPVSRIYELINDPKIKWANDEHITIKAYIMACFSELAYLHLTEYELTNEPRYKLFNPSLALDDFIKRGIRINLRDILINLDIPISVIETDNFVYVISKFRDFHIVAVRGTTFKKNNKISLDEVKIDLNAWHYQAPQGKYHRGFGKEAERAIPLLQNEIDNVSKIYFTGHSLGAAVASILTQLWPNKSEVAKPYIFSSPRFGTNLAVNWLPRYSYANPKDIVPHLPPKVIGYSDLGAEFYMIPTSKHRSSGFMSVLHTVRVKKYHSIEALRRGIGKSVQIDFPETIYIDSLLSKIRTS